MSVVISELELRPAADGTSDGAPAVATVSEGATRIDEQVLATLRREASRRARLWAD